MSSAVNGAAAAGFAGALFSRHALQPKASDEVMPKGADPFGIDLPKLARGAAAQRGAISGHVPVRPSPFSKITTMNAAAASKEAANGNGGPSNLGVSEGSAAVSASAAAAANAAVVQPKTGANTKKPVSALPIMESLRLSSSAAAVSGSHSGVVLGHGMKRPKATETSGSGIRAGVFCSDGTLYEVHPWGSRLTIRNEPTVGSMFTGGSAGSSPNQLGLNTQTYEGVSARGQTPSEPLALSTTVVAAPAIAAGANPKAPALTLADQILAGLKYICCCKCLC